MDEIFENLSFRPQEIQEKKSGLKEGVLAVVKGPAFFCDGYSRNGNYYPKSLWENALKLPRTKEAISRGLMFGCIGHPKNYTLDELLESGKVSHKVTSLEIDPKTGYGIATYEILDTASGRILNTIMRSGSEMYVSTRAFGGVTNETKKKDGREYRVLDANNFELESIDFVIQPGFLQTNPKIVESIKEDLNYLFEDKAKIQCVDGICQLQEDFESLNEEKSSNEHYDIFEDIESLPKEEIIVMLKNIVAENKLFTETNLLEIKDTDSYSSDDINSNEVEVDAKLLSNYVSYVELLTKMVRYNVEYEKFYEDLIVFLDKDDKLSESDIESISKIVEDILKEKDIDESLVKICEKIQNLTKLLDKETAEDEKTEGVKEEMSDIVSELLMKSRDNSALVQAEAKIMNLNGQIARLREATIALASENTEKTVVEVEKVVEKVVSKTPTEITEKLVSQKAMIETLKEELDSAREEIVSTVDEYHVVIEELNTRIEDLETTISENTEIAKDAIDEVMTKNVELKEQLETALNNLNVEETKVSELENRIVEAVRKQEIAEIAYFASVHRLDKSVVENVFNKYSTIETRKQALEKEAKLSRKTLHVVEDLPKFTPKSRNSETKSRLEALTK